MPAKNLLYVSRNNVFNCFDRITGFIKKQYTYTGNNFPTIQDALQPDTTLVIVSHADMHGVTSPAGRIGVSQFANDYIINNITENQRHKISKIVYLVCFSANTVIENENYSQVAPNGLLTYNEGLLSVENLQGLTPPNVVRIKNDKNGWIFTERNIP